MPGSTSMLVPMCQTPPHHIPWPHKLNTFYTENTDFICIFLAFRVAQHDSSSCNRSRVRLCHARKLTFLKIMLQNNYEVWRHKVWHFHSYMAYKLGEFHVGIEFGIFIPIGSTSLANFMLEFALLCVNLVDIETLQTPVTHTLCVSLALCPEVQ